MATYPASQGLNITMGFVCGRERFQCVVPYIAHAAFNAAQGPTEVETRVLAAWLPLWIACLADDCSFVGLHISSMAHGKALPLRASFATGAFPGGVAGGSVGPQESMLIAFHSTDQQFPGVKIRTGKQFIGPAPEANSQAGVIDGGQVILNDTLGAMLMTPWVGALTGITWERALESFANPASQVYPVNNRQVRTTTFTQRRRQLPIF